MERIDEKHNLKLTLDPRTKLFVLLIVSIVILVLPDLQSEWICMGVIILTLVCMKAYKQVLRSALIYGGLVGVLYICGLFPNSGFAAFFSMIAITFRKIAPPLFFASGMIATTKVGELISAMQKLRIPKSVVITFAVTLRFFPTAREEYASIKDAMRLRGIGVSAGNVLTRPLTVMESILIPMMMRCATIAEELSAAAVARGIESAGKRTSVTDLKMRVFDWLTMSAYLAMLIFFMMGGVSSLLQ